MVDACAANEILPFYGPFGDIADLVACEDQFRNASVKQCHVIDRLATELEARDPELARAYAAAAGGDRR